MHPEGILTYDASNFTGINAFPNPSSDGTFNIEIADGSRHMTDGKIEIYNVIGKEVFQSSINMQMLDSPITIDLSEQANGIYFMTLISGQYRFYQKLIKQ
jgi:hypothetical protein